MKTFDILKRDLRFHQIYDRVRKQIQQIFQTFPKLM